MPRFTNYLFYSLHEQNRLYNLKGYQAKNLIRMYLALLRATGSEDRAKIFLYDMFFFKSPRCHIAVCIFLDVWPEILMWQGYRTQEAFELRLIDPVLDSVLWCVYNTGPPSSTRDLQVGEAKERVNRECNVRFPQVSAVEFCNNLLNNVESRPGDQGLLEGTTRAMLLMCRWQTYRLVNIS